MAEKLSTVSDHITGAVSHQAGTVLAEPTATEYSLVVNVVASSGSVEVDVLAQNLNGDWIVTPVVTQIGSGVKTFNGPFLAVKSSTSTSTSDADLRADINAI